MFDLDPTLPPAGKPNTAAGFILAPGIASVIGASVVAGAVLLDPSPSSLAARLETAAMVMVMLPLAFAVVGYATAVIVALPVYLALPLRARGCFAVVVPLAGVAAAAPWLLLLRPWRHDHADLPVLAVPFGLGVVAGIAFLFLRRLPVVEAIAPAGPDGEASLP